ncbi:hypothetical protein AN2V17_46080 [Vallitalea sp. AN17-2]|uniref:Uncharacterized protein n=1 Tax=Vallitalea maricola TaxID=3074433 RepID=A0ACB5URQ8_9FIRM|nr:hypothetical protein AN2V17_46080 [Vallitalea sp. AN17-2]
MIINASAVLPRLTNDGEVAEKAVYSLDEKAIAKEAMYDGFYAVCTNLEEEVSTIAKINHQRWEIEECFRIMKSEFKARPVFLRRDDRIKAHFTTCFLALVLYRYLEKKLDNKFTTNEIINQLKDMNFHAIPGEGYMPIYTRTDFTDALHEVFGFRTDYQIVSNREMKKIYKNTKKKRYAKISKQKSLICPIYKGFQAFIFFQLSKTGLYNIMEIFSCVSPGIYAYGTAVSCTVILSVPKGGVATQFIVCSVGIEDTPQQAKAYGGHPYALLATFVRKQYPHPLQCGLLLL